MKQYQLSRFGVDGLALVDAPDPTPGRIMHSALRVWVAQSRSSA
jgi:hypothetical protein